jgi:Cyanate permease
MTATGSAVTTSRAGRVVGPAVVLLGLLALAANLRAALAGYPPLLETVRAALGMSAGAAGLVQASAILMMAVGSLTGSALGRRAGIERALGITVLFVAAGSLLRGLPALLPLIGGSLIVGLGIGMAGVLLTGVVKEHLPERAGAATGGYVVSMMVGATVSSAVAVPLATVLGGWSLSLAVWAVPAVLAVGLWTPIALRMPAADRNAPRTPLPWRDPFARLAACFMAGTSLLFYGWLTWLSPYYESQGWSPERAGCCWRPGACRRSRPRCWCRCSPTGAGAGGSGPRSRWPAVSRAPSARCCCRCRPSSGRGCGWCSWGSRSVRDSRWGSR